jgi:hypothetical protein
MIASLYDDTLLSIIVAATWTGYQGRYPPEEGSAPESDRLPLLLDRLSSPQTPVSEQEEGS